MICAEWVSTPEGLRLQPVDPQPADLSACQAVVLTGAESGSFSLFSFPSPTDAASAWMWGFSLVVGSYLAAWGTGAVLRLIRH